MLETWPVLRSWCWYSDRKCVGPRVDVCLWNLIVMYDGFWRVPVECCSEYLRTVSSDIDSEKFVLDSSGWFISNLRDWRGFYLDCLKIFVKHNRLSIVVQIAHFSLYSSIKLSSHRFLAGIDDSRRRFCVMGDWLRSGCDRFLDLSPYRLEVQSSLVFSLCSDLACDDGQWRRWSNQHATKWRWTMPQFWELPISWNEPRWNRFIN